MGTEQSATRDFSLLLTFDIVKGDHVSPFLVSHTADVAMSIQTVSKCPGWAVQQFRYKLQRPASYTWPKIHLRGRHMSRHLRPILQRIGMQSLVRYGADVTLLSTVAT